jgi:hypothetical protein
VYEDSAPRSPLIVERRGGTEAFRMLPICSLAAVALRRSDRDPVFFEGLLEPAIGLEPMTC